MGIRQRQVRLYTLHDILDRISALFDCFCSNNSSYLPHCSFCSLRTTLCLTKTPKIVALAALYVAGKYLDENLTDSFGEFWRESYEPHEREIHGTSAVLEAFWH